MKFVKMQGTGNDYIFIEDYENIIKNTSKLSSILSNRHFGVGADGLVLIKKSIKADARMQMFNADGSEGKMCGNAIRCLARFLFDEKNCLENLNFSKSEIENIRRGNGSLTLKIQTASGIKIVQQKIKNGRVISVSVNMGFPEFDKEKIPTLLNENEILKIKDKNYKVCCVSMGNPHCVVFVEEDVDKLELEKIGAKFENHPVFPERINTEFVNDLGRNRFKVRVWERGSGETLSCGTGACAVAAVAIKKAMADSKKEVLLFLKGGKLRVRETKKGMFLKGDSKKVFEGEIDVNL
ncbi:MAG: diaminopimelate epimerase [Clostridia bacterium]|nr:diaminopimelate epimerase [Clostridia bacterium]